MRKLSHRLFVVTAGLTVVAALLLSSMPASAKASGPKLKLSPGKNLANGQTIKVSGTGFTAGDSVYILECFIADTSLTGGGCNIPGLLGPETVTSKGALPKGLTFTVANGVIGADGNICGTTKTNAKACDISAGNPSGGDSTETPISFKIAKG